MGSIKPTKVRRRRWLRWLRWAAAVMAVLVAAAGLIVGTAVIAGPGWASPAAQSYANPTATLSIHVNGNPFGAVLTKDSHWMFVSFQGFSKDQPNGAAVLRLLTPTSWHMERFITLNPGVGGLALAEEDSQLFVADGDAIAVIDVGRATSIGSAALLGYLQTGFAFDQGT
jgi:hypothetical protein